MVMIPSKLLQCWQKAAKDLSLQLIAPFNLMLNSGYELKALFLVKQFGAPRGMLILEEFDDIAPHMDEIENAGYGFSILEEPFDNEEYDKVGYVELLEDWGWSGDMKDKPNWL